MARQVPWSWLKNRTIKQALCEDNKSLPLLELWPVHIQSIITDCLRGPSERPPFTVIQQSLVAVKGRGKGLLSETLDSAFTDWYQTQCNEDHLCKKSSVVKNSIPSITESETPKRGSSDIHVMVRRKSSSWSEKPRGSAVAGGLVSVLPQFGAVSHQQREIERFGYDIAKQLADVRRARKHAQKYSRMHWSKEVVLTRKLEGDIQRVKKKEKETSAPKPKQKKSLFSKRQNSLCRDEKEKLQAISCRYNKREWSKLSQGKETWRSSSKGFKDLVNNSVVELEKEQAGPLHYDVEEEDFEEVQLQWERRETSTSSIPNKSNPRRSGQNAHSAGQSQPNSDLYAKPDKSHTKQTGLDPGNCSPGEHAGEDINTFTVLQELNEIIRRYSSDPRLFDGQEH